MLIQIKPANGFEPMAFDLQKRCSTTELSRHRSHRTGYLAIKCRVYIPDQPKHQLVSIATPALSECPTDVALNGAVINHQSLGYGPVVEAFKQQQHHPLFSGGEAIQDVRFQA